MSNENVTLTKKELDRLIQLEMTKLDVKDLIIDNPLLKWGRTELDNPLLSTLRLLRNPDYVFFCCKYVLNVKLLPFQQVILQELWKSTFPMLIGSRGLSKCVGGETWVICDDGFKRIKDVVGDIAPMTPKYTDNLFLLGEKGFNEVEYVWNNGVTPTKKITTRYGYFLESTLNHPLRVVRNGNVEWVNTEDIVEGDFLPIDRSEIWPSETYHLSPELAYLFGNVAGIKYFPWCVLASSRESVAAFIRGLFDIDGYTIVNKTKKEVGFRSQSLNLITTLQFVLLRFGIVSFLKTQEDCHYITMRGNDAILFSKKIGFGQYDNNYPLPDKSNSFYDKVVKIEDSECTTYDVHMKSDDDRSFIANGFISHNSFLLGVYSILRALWFPGRKVVITGAGFRQAKTIMNYIETIWYNAPILRSMVRENSLSGPHHDADRWMMRLGESTITALPLGTGEKIRGERAHDILVDEYPSVPREIFETVVAGFGVVELEPYKKVEKAAEIRVLQKLGLWSEELEAQHTKSRMGNQSIISGTAYYQFNHFADYWKRWHGIITSRGDKKKLAQVVGPEAAEDIDWRDYSIIRIPYDILPSGYLDERHVIRSKSTVHSGIFLNEFSACIHPKTLILTPYGAKQIQDIVVGDSVMTHKGRFRRVTKTMTRQSTGEILYINNEVLITYDHPIWQGGDDDNSWIKASVGDSFHMPPLSELSSSSLSYTMGVNTGHNAYLTHEIIDPDILFSNPEFMRGFLEGYDNEKDGSYDCGDNRNLAVQIRMVLSYFNYFPTLEYDGGAYTLRNTNNDINLLPITHKDIVEYHGLVYNLEVQEDHSYVLMNGAVHNCFSSDSNGFFRRSLIEECVTNHPIKAGEDYVQFHCTIRGNPNGRYIYGVDPASEQDKFSIVILEVYDSHRRIVYCWTTDKSEHTQRIQQGVAAEHDFYGFCARKIRDLMRVFPCEHIAMDSQGGGVGIREALHDSEKLHKDEEPIWELKSSHPFNKTGSSSKGDKPTDRYPGLHILELCNFANFSYTVEANTGLRKDFEDHVCLFPISQDTATLAVAFEQDQIAKRFYDTYEDCFNEIEELKEELATIVQMPTAGGYRDRWDTPEVKLAGSRKGRLRKDRYSALVIANYAARRLARKTEEVPYQNFGGFVGQMQNHGREGPAYLSGPDWFINPVNNNPGGIGKIIRRGVK